MYTLREFLGETWQSIDQLLADAKDWARGEYLVWAQGERSRRRAGTIEVTPEHVEWFGADRFYGYCPPKKTDNTKPPACFGMYNPVQVETGRFEMKQKGSSSEGTVSFVAKRAEKLGYSVECATVGYTGQLRTDSTVYANGRARLRTSVTTGRKGGPEVLVEHWLEG